MSFRIAVLLTVGVLGIAVGIPGDTRELPYGQSVASPIRE